MRKPLVIGNWKMNGTRESVLQLLEGIQSNIHFLSQIETAVMPPFVYLSLVAKKIENTTIAYGAQNVSQYSDGAYTGEVSANMLRDLGCEYVILGHSERRVLFHESNELVAQKFLAAQRAGLKPILCVGENLLQRQAGETLKVVRQQLAAVLALVDNLPALTQAVVAYEPVWAIGTGQVATPEQAQLVHAEIRKQLAEQNADVAAMIRIIYGGSVKLENAASLFAMADIDGALVGGASLNAEQFIEIGKQCNNLS